MVTNVVVVVVSCKIKRSLKLNLKCTAFPAHSLSLTCYVLIIHFRETLKIIKYMNKKTRETIRA